MIILEHNKSKKIATFEFDDDNDTCTVIWNNDRYVWTPDIGGIKKALALKDLLIKDGYKVI